MTGLGHYGSSSSSNLSPLAPPFTVNRSNNNKPVVNSNPVSHFKDPTYAVSLTSPLPQIFGDSSSTTNDYGSIIPDSVVNSHNWSGLSSSGLGKMTPEPSHWSTFNLVPNRVADSSLYDFSEAKPFQHLYDSSVKNDDVPLVSFGETSSDLFSTSGLVHSDQTDYTRTLSGLEYSPNPNPNPNPNSKQEGVSSRLSLSVEKPVGKMEKDDSFFLQEANSSASFVYNDYFNQGAYGTETLIKVKDDPNMYYADIIRRANNNGKSDGTSSFANNHPRLASNELPKEESHFRAFPVFSESHSSLIQSPENSFWNSQKLTAPYEKRYHHMFEDLNLKPTTKSSPIVIKSPPAAVSAISASSKSMNSSDVMGTSHKILKEKDELQLPPLSFQIGTTDVTPFSSKDTKLSPASDQLQFEFKAKPSVVQLPDINIPDAASSFDNHNSAEDSPCWKGTPSLPFGSRETQPSTKKLQKTSSSSIPFLADTVDVDSSKVGVGGDDAIKPNTGHGYDTNSQIPKPGLPNLEEAVVLLAEMYGETADIKVDASILVQAMRNLSDLLVRACSNEALKEHDHEALDHVTCNLGTCMSRRVQVAPTSTNKLMSPHSNVSQESQVMNEKNGTLQDGEQHARSLSDLDPPKSDNMVQAIKKVLDENLECEVENQSETTLLYKNLWLESEAELCCLRYRARFERLKRETQKEKPHKSTATGDTIKEASRSCNGSASLKADNIKVSNAQHIDDDVVGVKVTGSGVTVQHQLCKDDDAEDEGVDSWVIARLNILKRREASNAIDQEAAMGSGSDWEHILKDEVSWR